MTNDEVKATLNTQQLNSQGYIQISGGLSNRGITMIELDVLDAIIQIAEAAFEMPEPIYFEGGCEWCASCGSLMRIASANEGHDFDCSWKNIHELKAQLENTD